jgi:ribosomal-protein-alanine N-acetyltransferase
MNPEPAKRPPAVVCIRWMVRKDMSAVLHIERESFENPWSELQFLTRLRKRNTIGIVAEVAGRVVGFMIYSLHKDKLRIRDLAVHHKFRREAVGGQLVAKLLAKLTVQGRSRVTATLRMSNLPAQDFFRYYGFKTIRVCRSGDDHEKDAVVMAFTLPPTPKP